MNHGEFTENEPVPYENMITSMMTATIYLNDDEGNVQPAMEIRAHTATGKEIPMIIMPVLVAPLLESIMRLFQAYVGEPQNSGSYDVPDNPDDINWSQP